jgi:hypothetical protein
VAHVPCEMRTCVVEGKRIVPTLSIGRFERRASSSSTRSSATPSSRSTRRPGPFAARRGRRWT